MPQYVYRISLVLLVVSLSTYSIELSFLTSLIVLALTFSSKANRRLTVFSFLLMSLVLTGMVASYDFKSSIFDWIKDFVYFSRPIFVLLASYFVVKRVKSENFVFNTVIIIAFIFALKHLFLVLINIGSIDSYIYLRNLGGKQNHIETVALIFLFFTPFHYKLKKHKRLIQFIILLSFLLYLSRTMFITLFIFFLAYKGYLFLNIKLIKGLFVFMTVATLIGVTVLNIDTNRDSKGIKAFIYKTKNSFTEMFEAVDTEYILRDRRSLWEHWRAYEAQKAIEQLNERGTKAWLIGMGYGPPIRLDTHVKLDGKIFTEVPSIHNGFIYVLFKTGIIGLLFYLSFIAYGFVSYQKFKTNQNNSIYNKLLVATSLYIFLNSFVITGFFRPGEFSIFLLGILIASKQKAQKQESFLGTNN